MPNEGNKSLKGRVAWITGGKRIGQEIAKSLASRGSDLIVTYRTSEKEALDVAEKVRPYGGRTMVLQCDVSNRESVVEALEHIKKEFGRIDFLVMLASIFKPVKLEEISEKDWDTNFSTHVKGTFWPIQMSAPMMPPGSHIVTISDRTAIGRIYSGYLPYVVTKSAVASMTRALGIELGPKGIYINSIAPGPVLRPDDISEEEWRIIRSESVIKYSLSDDEAVKEFVDTVLRLLEVRSTGSVYPLDFGHL